MPLPPAFWAAAAQDKTISKKDLPSFVKIIDDTRILVRVVGKPFNYKVHYYPDKNGRLHRAFCTGEKCSHCTDESLPATARRAFLRYSMWVIQDRNLAILEVGSKLFQSIGKVVRETTGPTENYDIGILKSGKGYDAIYSVNPCPVSKYDENFWQEINDRISKFSMRGLVGDLQAREAMELELEEEERVLNKSW